MSLSDEYARDSVWGPMSHPAKAEIEPNQPPWKDHIYLAFWDATNDAYGFLHWNSSPNHNTGKAQATVLLAGRFHDLKEFLPAGVDRFVSPSMDYDLQGDIKINGPELQGELTVTPRFVPVDYSGGKQILPLLVPGKPLDHWQQGLQLRGELTLGADRRVIDALGFRTRTWGFRDDSLQFTEYFSLFACFPNFDISIMKFRQPDGSHRTDGEVVHADGRTVRFHDMHITRDSAGSPIKLVLDVLDGSTLTLKRLRRTASMWCPIGPPEREGPTFAAFDEFIEWQTDDGAIGIGLNEQAIIRYLF